MKWALTITLCLGAALAAAAVSWQTAAREREYGELLERGEAALATRDTFSAIEAYSGAIALHPDSMLPYLRRGETYQVRGDLESAARDFRQAADLEPSATRPLEALGTVLYAQDRLPQAAAAFERRLELDDTSTDVAYRLALTRYRLGDYAGALVRLEGVLAADDSSAEAHYLRGLCLRDAGELDSAVEAFEAAISRSPGLIPAREELADVYGRLRRFSAEIEQLQVIAGLDRTAVGRQVEVAMALARAARSARTPATAQRNDDLAILTLGSALDRAPDQPGIYGALGKVWLEIAVARDDRVALSKALEAFDQAATAASVPSDVLSAYGRALILEGEIGAAARVLEQAMRQYPVDPAAFSTYSNVAERRGQLDAARRALIEYDALVDDREDLDRRALRIAALSLRLEDPATAVHWLERALLTSPDDVGLLVSLADAHLTADEVASAREVIVRGLAAHPHDERLRALAKRAGLPD